MGRREGEGEAPDRLRRQPTRRNGRDKTLSAGLVELVRKASTCGCGRTGMLPGGASTRRSSISRCGMRFRPSLPAMPPSATRAPVLLSRKYYRKSLVSNATDPADSCARRGMAFQTPAGAKLLWTFSAPPFRTMRSQRVYSENPKQARVAGRSKDRERSATTAARWSRTIRIVDNNVPVTTVWASRGKAA